MTGGGGCRIGESYDDWRQHPFLSEPWTVGRPRLSRQLSSGHVYRQVFEILRPRVFTDPMVGGGTSVEVAHEMGIEAHGLDLHSGFNILKQRIIEAVGKPSDLVLSHPPYHNIVVYSVEVWGRVGHPRRSVALRNRG